MNTDRRTTPRVDVERAGKLVRRHSAEFVPTITHNISSTGALVEVRTPRPFGIGETVRVAIAWDGQAILQDSALARATVVRIDAADTTSQRLALAYVPAEPVIMTMRAAA